MTQIESGNFCFLSILGSCAWNSHPTLPTLIYSRFWTFGPVQLVCPNRTSLSTFQNSSFPSGKHIKIVKQPTYTITALKSRNKKIKNTFIAKSRMVLRSKWKKKSVAFVMVHWFWLKVLVSNKYGQFYQH